MLMLGFKGLKAAAQNVSYDWMSLGVEYYFVIFLTKGIIYICLGFKVQCNNHVVQTLPNFKKENQIS